VDAGSLESGDVLSIVLPDDVQMKTASFVISDDSSDADNMLYVPEFISGGDDNGVQYDMIDNHRC